VSEHFHNIMQRPVEERFALLLERYGGLDEYTGNRTTSEVNEMNQIAQAVMPKLIRDWKLNESRSQ
jgi:hypothetical protein